MSEGAPEAIARLIGLMGVLALVTWSWWRLLRGIHVGVTLAERWLMTGILVVGQVVLSTLLLAATGLLAAPQLFGVNIVLAIAGLAACWRLPASHSPATGGVRAALRPGWPTAALMAGTGLTLVCIAIRAGVQAPGAYDALNYRLPIAAWMLQTGSYRVGPAHLELIDSYPRNVECWFTWMLAAFGSGRWMNLAQLPFLPLAMLATYVLARRLGTSPFASRVASLLLLFAPVVMAQLITPYADVAISALVLSAVALLFVVREVPSRGVLAVLGVSLGLLLGMRFSGVLYVPVLLAGYVTMEVSRKRSHLARRIAGVVALTLLLGGYAYVRNTWLHGNPLFPYRVSLLGWQLPGTVAATDVSGLAETADMGDLERTWRSWSAVQLVTHSSTFGGFGLVWPFLLCCVPFSLALSLGRRDWGRVGLGALFLLLFLITPLHFRVRFVIFVLGYGWLCVAHLWDHLVACATLRGALVVGSVAVTGHALLGFYGKELGDLKYVTAQQLSDASRSSHFGRPIAYRGAYRWIEDHVPAGATLYYFRGQEIFAFCLWNRDLTSRVEYVVPAGRQAFRELTRGHPDAFYLLPAGSDEHALAHQDAERIVERYRDDAVELVQFR